MIQTLGGAQFLKTDLEAEGAQELINLTMWNTMVITIWFEDKMGNFLCCEQ